jgi:hypothetical protein
MMSLPAAAVSADENMGSPTDCGHPEPQQECHGCCIEVATGVLMQRGGLTPDEARGSLRRTAQRKDVPMHVWAREVIESAVNGPH